MFNFITLLRIIFYIPIILALIVLMIYAITLIPEVAREQRDPVDLGIRVGGFIGGIVLIGSIVVVLFNKIIQGSFIENDPTEGVQRNKRAGELECIGSARMAQV